MADHLEPRIEDQISAWRAYVSRPEAIDGRDVDELEDHLRGQIDRLAASGLDDDEAFLVAVKRLGGLDDLSREFAREHSDRLWKQLMIPGESRAPRSRRARARRRARGRRGPGDQDPGPVRHPIR